MSKTELLKPEEVFNAVVGQPVVNGHGAVIGRLELLGVTEYPGQEVDLRDLIKRRTDQFNQPGQSDKPDQNDHPSKSLKHWDASSDLRLRNQHGDTLSLVSLQWDARFFDVPGALLHFVVHFCASKVEQVMDFCSKDVRDLEKGDVQALMQATNCDVQALMEATNYSAAVVSNLIIPAAIAAVMLEKLEIPLLRLPFDPAAVEVGKSSREVSCTTGFLSNNNRCSDQIAPRPRGANLLKAST